MDRSRGSGGKAGGLTRLKKDDKEFEYDKKNDPLVPQTPPSEGPKASVGLSVNIGMSTQFGAQKVDVSVWCTLPCDPDRESRNDAYDECANHVMSELQARLDQAINKFFPELAGNQ